MLSYSRLLLNVDYPGLVISILLLIAFELGVSIKVLIVCFLCNMLKFYYYLVCTRNYTVCLDFIYNWFGKYLPFYDLFRK